ncbi:LysR substrate binding domain-containing protein [Halomonas daqiaonensis]|uniref:LysR substrate binding domain-containing protein n=1 Tax=Halomonas daqiaonensis TaxID=650850 RepID=A0A1H7JVT6_9GAMM|nr:LysR substrate binding domain-containing protein [Halomonas daqiaonensis]
MPAWAAAWGGVPGQPLAPGGPAVDPQQQGVGQRLQRLRWQRELVDEPLAGRVGIGGQGCHPPSLGGTQAPVVAALVVPPGVERGGCVALPALLVVVEVAGATLGHRLEGVVGRRRGVLVGQRPGARRHPGGRFLALQPRQQGGLVQRRVAEGDRRAQRLGPPAPFPEGLAGRGLIVPGPESSVRHAFDCLCELHRLSPTIIAEVDDMALMRLLARDTAHLAVLPPVVVRDELRVGTLSDFGALPGVFEELYAITVRRQFESPLMQQLLAQSSEMLLPTPPV